MRLGKSSSAEDLRIVARYETLRAHLLEEPYAAHLGRPLAYWALPADRRLPLALLGRKLHDLLATPLAQLAATPGIGRKKMASFVALLERAARTDPAELPTLGANWPKAADVSPAGDGDGNLARFDADEVSEAAWAGWRASVVRNRLEAEPLGRLAPSLQGMTRGIWNKPLGEYTGLTLAEIRSMKTHGEKRMQAILDVFHTVHALTDGLGEQVHLAVRLSPCRIGRVERWADRTLQSRNVPSRQDIQQNYVDPLLDQICVDSSRQVVELAESRLGVGGPIASVRQAARSMMLTRARVYQLLNEIGDVMSVRWPAGRHLSHELRDMFAARPPGRHDAPDLSQFVAAIELFFPGGRRGDSNPAEDAFEPLETHATLLEV